MITIASVVIGAVVLFDLYALFLVCQTLVHSFKDRKKYGRILTRGTASILVTQLYVLLCGLIVLVNLILIAMILP